MMNKKEFLEKVLNEKFSSIAGEFQKVMTIEDAQNVFLESSGIPSAIRILLANMCVRKLSTIGYKRSSRVSFAGRRFHLWYLKSEFKNERDAIAHYTSREEVPSEILSSDHPMCLAINSLGSPKYVYSKEVYSAISKYVPRHSPQRLGAKVKKYMKLLGYSALKTRATIGGKRGILFFKPTEISAEDAECLHLFGKIITDFRRK